MTAADALTATKASQLAKLRAKIDELISAGDATSFTWDNIFSENVAALQADGYLVTTPYTDFPNKFLIEFNIPL